MPLTPFHLGPGLLFGVITFRFLNLWAILLGSVAMDIEPFSLLIINPCYSCPHHGILHSIIGAVLGSLLAALILWKLREPFNKISLKFKIRQSFSFPVLFFSSFFGWLIHIFLDNLTHYDVFLLWPLKYKPFFFGPKIYWPLNYTLFALGVIGLIILYIKLKKQKSC